MTKEEPYAMTASNPEPLEKIGSTRTGLPTPGTASNAFLLTNGRVTQGDLLAAHTPKAAALTSGY